MSSAINNGTFTFNKEELKDFSKVVHELIYADVEMERLHDIVEGIKYNMQIVLSANGGLVGKKITGCTPNTITGVTFSEKTWTPAFEDLRLEHCSADVNQQDKLVNQMKKMNPDYFDVFSGSNSSIGAFLVASVLERLKPEIIRKAWFNQLSIDTIANGGVLTNGTDKGYFNTFDGIFTQFFTNAPLVAKRRYTVTKNAAATYALQALAANEGIEIIRGVWKKADLRLRNDKTAYIAVTQTVYDQYLDDLEDIENKGAGNITTTTDGKTKVTYRGMEVIAVDIWDRTIDLYMNNGTKWNLPHRAVVTVPRNVPIGTLSKGDFGTLEAFYDKVSKKNYIDAEYSIDAKIIEDYLIAMAY